MTTPARIWPFLSRYSVEVKPLRNGDFGYRWGRGYRLNSSYFHQARLQRGDTLTPDESWDALRADIDDLFKPLCKKLGVQL
mgnify:CR=1 FL=1